MARRVNVHVYQHGHRSGGGGFLALLGLLIFVGLLIKYWYVVLAIGVGWLVIHTLIKLADSPLAPPETVHTPDPQPVPLPEPDDAVPAPDLPLKYMNPDIAQAVVQSVKRAEKR